MRGALLQMSSSDDPVENLATLTWMISDAKAKGAGFVLTPEVTNCVSLNRQHQNDVLHLQQDDPTLAACQDLARAHKIWLLLGSLGVKTTDADGRFANRSLLIDPDGIVRASYDKIHMFDVDINETESFRESDGYRPGSKAVVADAGFAKLGLSICYDVRFAHLYRALATAGAQILTVPAAFSPVTGKAHWHSLLRARAIETGCFVLAPAQTGTHRAKQGATRSTYGHSLVVSPWGEIILDAGTEPGVYMFDLDLNSVNDARRKVPALHHARNFDGPE
ncbi:MAG: carbon-nitrogen hydrolase family protein [Paracoccaceae bacterium]